MQGFCLEFVSSVVGMNPLPKDVEQKFIGKEISLTTPKAPRKKKEGRVVRSPQKIAIPSKETIVKLNQLWDSYCTSLLQPNGNSAPINEASVAKMELIGAKISVLVATVPGNLNLSGVILRETRTTISIVCEGMLKTIPKLGHVFRMDICGGKASVTLFGSALITRSQDRINKKWKPKHNILYGTF